MAGGDSSYLNLTKLSKSADIVAGLQALYLNDNDKLIAVTCCNGTRITGVYIRGGA